MDVSKFFKYLGILGLVTIFQAAYAFDRDENLQPFNEIRLNVGGNVTLIPGNQPRIRVSVTRGDAEHLEVQVKNGALVLDDTRRTFTKTLKALFTREEPELDVEGTIVYSTLNEIRTNFGADVNSDSLVTNSLKLGVWGSGDINIDRLDVQHELDLSINGSGDILIKQGAASRSEVSIMGSGNINFLRGEIPQTTVNLGGSGSYSGRNVATINSVVRLVGSGDASVQASGVLDVTIMGSGSVIYRGNAQLKQNLVGSGTITKE